MRKAPRRRTCIGSEEPCSVMETGRFCFYFIYNDCITVIPDKAIDFSESADYIIQDWKTSEGSFQSLVSTPVNCSFGITATKYQNAISAV